MTSVLSPMVVFDERRAINRLIIKVASIRYRLDEQYSREWLETTLQQCLREGELKIASMAVEAADKGDEIADAALRKIGAELQVLLVQGRDLAPGHLQVIAYFQRVALRAPHKRKRGRAWYDDWYRNHAICVLIIAACLEFGVQPTRNRESRRADRQPSGISQVTAALARNRINLDESTIQRKIWFGLPGALMRKAMAERTIRGIFSV
jgi:hypothetical protein